MVNYPANQIRDGYLAKPTVAPQVKAKKVIDYNHSSCLMPLTAQKIALKLLRKKNLSKKQLAQLLGITASSVEKLLTLKRISTHLLHKVSTSLIQLYCSTRW